MFDLPDDYKTMDAATYDDVIRGIDLDGKLIDDINILSTVMLHEVRISSKRCYSPLVVFY